jgi:transcriptional regulator NrdR family protein
MVSANLHRRGLNKSVAEKKVSQSLQGEAHTNDLMAQNILENMSDLKQEDIIAYLSNCALYGKSIDLSSYESIVSLVQQSNKFVLEKADVQIIQKISLENQYIKSFSKTS